MLNPFLSSDQQAIVVFRLWKSLNYWIRMVLGVGCILGGLFLQYYYYHDIPYDYFLAWQFWLGGLLLVVGNLFLVVRGIDNRVRFGGYSPSSEWEKVEESKLLEAEQLVKKMKKWDRNILDASNALGCFTFFILLTTFGVLFIVAVVEGKSAFCIIIADAALLLCPHWVTGQRSLSNKPKLLLRIETIKKLLKNVTPRLQDHQVEYFMLLKGQKAKAPDDVKFCVKIQNQHPDFLGLYGQVVINRGIYPYFYVVLVAKKGYGLQETFKSYRPPGTLIKEFKVEEDVEVLVIRQVTTKTSGYHTRDTRIREIFLEGLELAETSLDTLNEAKEVEKKLQKVFEDDFKDNKNKWSEADDENTFLKVKDGHYVVEHKREKGAWMSWNATEIEPQKDFYIEVTMSKVSGPDNRGYGMLWGLKDDKNYHLFYVSGNGSFAAGKLIDEKWQDTITWLSSPCIHQGNATNTLSVKKIGSQIKFYINDCYVAALETEEAPGNNVGFIVYHKMKVNIEHILVKGIRMK